MADSKDTPSTAGTVGTLSHTEDDASPGYPSGSSARAPSIATSATTRASASTAGGYETADAGAHIDADGSVAPTDGRVGAAAAAEREGPALSTATAADADAAHEPEEDSNDGDDEEHYNASRSSSQTGAQPINTALAIPPPSSATTPTSFHSMTPALQLRLGLFHRLKAGVLSLRGRTKFVLGFTSFLSLAQVATFITLLALTASDPCDKPLRTYLALHVVRVSVAAPIKVYNALAPRRRRGDEDTEEARERRERNRLVGNQRLDARVRGLTDLVSLFSFLWFVLGNFWVFSSLHTCRASSPELWWGSMASLIISYLRAVEILAIVLAVVFFLPVVLLGMRMFGGLEKKHEIGPLTKEQIEKLPKVCYIPAPPEEGQAKHAPEAGTDEGAAQSNQISTAVSDKPEVQRVELEMQDLSRPEAASPKVPPAVAEPAPSPATGPPVALPATEAKNPAAPPATAARPRRRHLLRLFFRRHREAPADTSATDKSAGPGSDGIYVSTPHPLHALPDNLSTCPICLCDFLAPPLRSESAADQAKKLAELETLNLLPCGHCLHKDCLAEWLATSGRCPVCQAAVYPELEDKEGKKGGRIRRRSRTASTAAPASGDGQGQQQNGSDNNV